MADQPSDPGNSSTSELSQAQGGISVANQGLSFVQGLDQLLGNPLSRTFQSWNHKGEKKALLGEWHDFLYDSKADVYYVPVLEKAQFWEYIVKANGILRPQGTCQATADWARLLYGLGISPKTEIVSKVLRTCNTQENHTSKIELELDGEIVCHIVNLYGKNRPKRTVTAEDLRSATEWPTLFGSFGIPRDANSNRIQGLRYIPGSEQALAAVKRPFAELSSLSGRQDPDSYLTMYELALDLGTSDTSIAWPDKTSNITIRTKAVLHAIDALCYVPWTLKPILITTSWMSEPDSILRRVSTNGRTDSSFLVDVLRMVDSLPGDDMDRDDMDRLADLREEAFRVFCCVDKGYSPRYASVSQTLSRSPKVDMTGNAGHYEYEFPLRSLSIWEESAPDDSWVPILSNIIHDVLQSYAHARAGSRKKMLYDNAEAVRDYMMWMSSTTRRTVDLDPGRVCILPLDRASRLWAVDELLRMGWPSHRA